MNLRRREAGGKEKEAGGSGGTKISTGWTQAEGNFMQVEPYARIRGGTNISAGWTQAVGEEK